MTGSCTVDSTEPWPTLTAYLVGQHNAWNPHRGPAWRLSISGGW